jgi:predicted nucleic-acid-binding protein
MLIAVDTNIVVRFLTRDDEIQYQKAYALFQSHQVYVSNTVILETEWVLRYAYDFPPAQIIEAFNKLFGLSNVTAEDSGRIALTLEWHGLGMDFADAFHLAASQHCEAFYTFDEAFEKKGKDVSLCPIKFP